jgi:hypothetical protein
MELYRRENYLKRIRGFYDAEDLIKVITGVRRCGKSSLMQTIAQEIKAAGVPEENILYIDLDRRGYKGIRTAAALETLIDSFPTASGLKYLFIDEIQNVSGFEELLNGYRTDGGWSIFVTGSNSYLFSGEIMTKLTGRYIEFEMLPLTFEEYEGMKAFYGKTIEPDPFAELNAYILEGGFPRTIFFDDLEDKYQYVQGIVREIFEKDIRRRVKIRKRESFELVQAFTINNFGAQTSLTSLHKALNRNGYVISKATVSRYIRALLDAKIIYECPRFDMKSKRALQGEKKYYLSDLSFYFATNTNNTINYGPVLENIVYTYARSHGYSVSVGRIGTFECDFILRSPMRQYAYVQVAFMMLMDKKTEDREYRPLETIRDNYPRYVITADPLIQQRSGIRHVNLMRFMRAGELF